jgi:lysophospholipase L1-like esterase
VCGDHPRVVGVNDFGIPDAGEPTVTTGLSPRGYRRYVALGDSSTEGLDDPYDGEDGGYRGWADRLAEQVEAAWPGLEYANLAVRGRLAGQVEREQVPAALALQPDLVTVFAGLNDVLRPRVDPTAVADTLTRMMAALRAGGATVLTITVPDAGQVNLIARPLRRRVLWLNDAIRDAAARTGTLVCDVAAHPVAGDPRMWSLDRLHANSLGHERIAAGLAQTLVLPGSGAEWMSPLPAGPAPGLRGAIAAELIWGRRYFLPWLGRRLRGASSGDSITAKRPHPTAVRPNER